MCNRTIHPTVSAGLPLSAMIKSLHRSRQCDALHLGWDDFKAVPSHAIILCVIYPVLGIVLFRLVLGY